MFPLYTLATTNGTQSDVRDTGVCIVRSFISRIDETRARKFRPVRGRDDRPAAHTVQRSPSPPLSSSRSRPRYLSDLGSALSTRRKTRMYACESARAELKRSWTGGRCATRLPVVTAPDHAEASGPRVHSIPGARALAGSPVQIPTTSHRLLHAFVRNTE